MNNFILCKPNRKTLCVLNGVQLDSVSYTPKLNDLDEITFTVDKYIVDDDGNEIVSQGYEQLHAFMEVYLDWIGYFQIKEPQISNDGDRETKIVTGVSTDCELLQKDLVGFTVNKTTANSLEMLADNNVNSLGYPNEYITFYNPSNPQLSVMDLVLEKAVGWKVGFIDDFLKNLRFVFDNVNENILSFLTKTLSSTARCIFDFDTVNKTVSAYAENHIGEDTGIIIAYRNLLNKVDVSCDSDNIFTRLNVQGKDSLTFADINYGDTHVFNLDYYKNINYMDDELITKLDIWKQARNDNREDYILKVKTYHDYVEQISEIDNKVPTNGVLNNWDNMSMDELTKNQTYYNSLIKSFQITAQNTHPQGSETIYTGNLDDYTPSRLNPDGTVNHESYMADLDGQGKETYREIITYVLPNIQIAIDNFDKTATEKSDYLTAYLTEWDLYGIVELKAKQSSYEEQLNTLKDYAKNWSDLTDEEKTSHGNNQANYELYHNEYTKIDGYLTAIASKLTELDIQKQSLLASRDTVQAELKQIRNDMAITGGRVVDGIYTNWFTNDEIELINLLFHDTDYTNENILITSLDDFNKQLEIEQELYDDAVAQLEELSVPQYSFSCELDNLLDIKEFKEWKDDFKIGNFITLEVSPNCFTKLRLVSITYNPCIKSNDLTVEFSNMVTTKSGRNDFSYIFDKAISVAKNSITYSNNQSKDSIELSTELLNLLSGSSVFQGKFDNLELKNISANEAQIVKLTADYVKVKELDAKYATIDFANITEAAIDKLKTTSLFADYIKADEIEANYLKTNFANIDNANIDIANIGILFNKVGLIDRATIVDGHITGYLDAVEINANSITAGTLIADRILLKAPVGSERNGLLYAINNLGELSSSSVQTIDGYVLTDRTINADKIVAKTITANEIASKSITADEIVAGAITSNEIAANAITSNKLSTDAIKSTNYIVDTSGSFLNLADGSFDSKYLKWDESGILTATSGTIAGWEFNSGYLCKKLKSGDTEANDRYVYINTELSTQDANGEQHDSPRGRIIGVNTSLEGRRNQISATGGALYINADGSIYSSNNDGTFLLQGGEMRVSDGEKSGKIARLYSGKIDLQGTPYKNPDGIGYKYSCNIDGGILQFCKLAKQDDGLYHYPDTGYLYLGTGLDFVSDIDLGITGMGLCSDTEDITIATGGKLNLRGASITATGTIIGNLNGTATNADTVDGKHASDFALATDVQGIDIGARNIATGTASMTVGKINSALWSNGQWRYSGTGSIATIDITDSPVPSISKGIRVTSTQAQKQIGIVQDKIPLNSDNIYTLSCWVRGSAASGLKCKLQPFYASSTDTGGALEINITDQWQYVSFTTVRSPQNTAEYSAAYIYLISSAIGDTMDICGVKLERGNKATDWSPAPEDKADKAHTHSDYLPLTGGTITGNTDFNAGDTAWNLKCVNTGFEKGTIPTDSYYWALNFMDKNGGRVHENRIGYLTSYVAKNTGTTITEIVAMKNKKDSSDSARIAIGKRTDGTEYLKLGSTTIGSTDTPVYINAGQVTPTSYKFSDFMLASGKGAISEEHSFWSNGSSHTFNYVSGRNRAFIIAWMDDGKATYMGFNLIYAATTVSTTSAVKLAYNGTYSMTYTISNGNITIGGGGSGFACRCAVIWFTV